MNQYEEIIEGRTLVRSFPGARHERICARLHERVGGGPGRQRGGATP